MIEEFFSGYKTFSELEPKDRLKLLFDYLQYIYKHPKLTRSEMEYFYSKDRNIEMGADLSTLDYIFWGANFASIYPKGYPARWYFKVSDLGKKILDRGYIVKGDYKDAPDWVIRRLERPPVSVLERGAEFISPETSDGYGELWYSVVRRLYYTKIDGKINIIFRRLVLVVTASVATGGLEKKVKLLKEGVKKKGGFEQMTCEVTGWSIVKRMKLDEINNVGYEISDFLDETLEKYFGVRIKNVAIKMGVEMYTEESIEGETNEGVKIEDIEYPHMKVYIEYSHAGVKGPSSPIEVEK